MKETVYFGTYTRRTSQGIYKADFDTETGQLSNLELFAAEPSPTYLAFDQHQHLYTVGSQDDKGGIAAYQTDGTVLNHVVEEGAPTVMLLSMKSVIWFTQPTITRDKSLFINARKMVVFYLVIWINTVAKVHMKIKLPPMFTIQI